MKRSLTIILLLLAAATRRADDRPEYRAYWVDTFRTPFATKADVERIIDAAVESNANALFVQVRRRGDAWYLDAAEPLAEAMDGTFDPLRALLDAAHARGIEVHAFVIVGAVFHGDPKNDPLPRDREPRFPPAFLGREDEAAVSRRAAVGNADEQGPLSVRVRLVRRPRASRRGGVHGRRAAPPRPRVRHRRHSSRPRPLSRVAARRRRLQRDERGAVSRALRTPAAREGSALERLAARAGHEFRPPPRPRRESDPAVDHDLGGAHRLGIGSGSERRFPNTDAYRVAFQDWEAWLREGIIDVASPMLYKREHAPAERKQFDDWLQFVVATAHANGRAAVPGIGAYLNSIEGTLRQSRRAREANADGILFFAMGDTKPWSILANSTNNAVRQNPYALPVAGVFTPKRPNEEFFAALRTSTATDGRTAFEQNRASAVRRNVASAAANRRRRQVR